MNCWTCESRPAIAGDAAIISCAQRVRQGCRACGVAVLHGQMDQDGVARRIGRDPLLEVVDTHRKAVLVDDLLDRRAGGRELRVGLRSPLTLPKKLVEVGVGRLGALPEHQRDPALVDLRQVDRHEVRDSPGDDRAEDQQPEPRTQDADLAA